MGTGRARAGRFSCAAKPVPLGELVSPFSFALSGPRRLEHELQPDPFPGRLLSRGDMRV